MPTTETAAPIHARIVTGHFRERPPYATWRTRGTTDWLLVLTLSGRGRYGYDGGEIEAGDGDAVLIRPGTLHDYGIARQQKSWEIVWAHFHPRADWVNLLDWPEAASGLMHIALGDGEVGHSVTATLHEMHALSTGAYRRREFFATNALERALLLIDTVNPRSAEARIDERVLQAMRIMLANLSERFSLHPAADACGLSTSRLAHLFAEQTGTTPQRFVEKERLTRAAQELAITDRPIQVIAADLGFESPFYFSRRFKLFAGISPQQYREGRKPVVPRA